MTNYLTKILKHYEEQWKAQPRVRRPGAGPIHQLPSGFCVLEFAPSQQRSMWTYATCGMSQETDSNPIELHLFSPTVHEPHVELLTAVAHYHRTGVMLGLWHTVNFGRPWMPDSSCSCGMISLPYLDGPELESINDSNFKSVLRFYWLIPITPAEREYKKVHGREMLEEQFEKAQFNYLDPFRASIVA